MQARVSIQVWNKARFLLIAEMVPINTTFVLGVGDGPVLKIVLKPKTCDLT